MYCDFMPIKRLLFNVNKYSYKFTKIYSKGSNKLINLDKFHNRNFNEVTYFHFYFTQNCNL